MSRDVRILINVLDDADWILDEIKKVFADDDIYHLQLFTQPQPFIAAYSNSVDLIITDVRVNGYDVVEALKSFSQLNPSCYMVVISAYLDDLYDTLINDCRVDKTVKKTSDYSWIELLRTRVEELKPRILGKPKFNTNGG